MFMEDLHLVITFGLMLLNLCMAVPAAIHALMNKEPVQSAIGWTAVIILSPFLGSILYFFFGVNRVSRRWRRLKLLGFREAHSFFTQEHLEPLQRDFDTRLGDEISPFSMVDGNRIEMLKGGAMAYPAMLEAIQNAKRSIVMQTYIFDSGKVGDQFLNALGDAVQRGVQVRVLIDRVGSLYSKSIVHKTLKEKGVKTAFFDDSSKDLRLPNANLRNHRKILVVDNQVGFMGGMNIRDSFALPPTDPGFAMDTHFKLTGPITDQLQGVFAQDWFFTTREELPAELWQKEESVLESENPAALRVIPSEPDYEGSANLLAVINNITRAKKSIMIQSAYFLPVSEMLFALRLAAMRGVQVDLLMPGKSNLFFVDLAAMGQLNHLAASGCNIWQMQEHFNHSKLMVVDDNYAYVGSSNMDARSLRLNFEVDLEVLNAKLVNELAEGMRHSIANSTRVSLQDLRERPFIKRFVSRLVWLFSPYL